jgi:hypothetical protein
MKDLFSPAFKKVSAYFLTFLMLFYTYGCFRNYFKPRVVTVPQEVPQLEELGQIHKYFIVHRTYQALAFSASDTVRLLKEQACHIFEPGVII